jgi:DnaJ-domain-containing protein 1
MVDAAFMGFKALPAPDGSPMIGRPSWNDVLGVELNSTKEVIRKRYLELAKENHPDNGGSTTTFQIIKEAYEEGIKR